MAAHAVGSVRPVRVIEWQQGRWRAEEHRDGWRLYYLRGQMLSRASLDQVVRFLLDNHVDPEHPDKVS